MLVHICVVCAWVIFMNWNHQTMWHIVEQKKFGQIRSHWPHIGSPICMILVSRVKNSAGSGQSHMVPINENDEKFENLV